MHTWLSNKGIINKDEKVGDRYEGEWKACLREGYGTDFFSNKDQYTG